MNQKTIDDYKPHAYESIKYGEGIRYAKGFEPTYLNGSCNNQNYKPVTPYFIGGSGLMYDYEAIASWLKRCENYGAKIKGLHIFEQLKFLKIFEDFDLGTTSKHLPLSFY